MTNSHIVIFPFEAWGHVRPLLYTSIQLLSLHPQLFITFLVSSSVGPRITQELASANFSHLRKSDDSQSAAVLDRMQVIEVKTGVVPQPGQGMLEVMKAVGMAYAAAIPSYFSALSGQGEIEGMENKFQGEKPSCVVYDMFQSFIPDMIGSLSEKIAGKAIPIFGYLPSGPTATMHHLAKQEAGGFIARLQRLVGEGVTEGKEPLQVVAPLGLGDCGQIKHFPGLPAMTDYEFHPGVGSCPQPPEITLAIIGMVDAAWSPYQTGFVLGNVYEMESEATLAAEEHFKKPFLSFGFQYDQKVWKGEAPPPAETDKDGLEAMAFLDDIAKRRGSKSAVYISFGSAWFPFARPQIVHHLIDTLISSSTPFLFAYATELFPVPQDLLDKVEAYPDGHAVRIAPQVQVLHHPATGFFVSHCGANSLAEAVVAGVPIVGLPFAADQGEHVHLLVKYKAGIDLKQAKCFFGEGDKPKVLHEGTPYVGTDEAIKTEMTELWAGLKGDQGRELTQGMKGLREICTKSCAEGGKSRQAMLDFSKYF